MLLRQPRSNLRPCAHTIYMSVIGLRYRSALLMDVVALEPREEGAAGSKGGKGTGQRDSPASWLAWMSGRDGCPGDRQPLWDRAQSNRA